MTTMVKIVNLRKYKPSNGEIVVRIDRSNPILGNPHYLHRESDREMVCQLYDNMFNSRINNDIIFISELERIIKFIEDGNDIVLGCWCVPKRCHGDIILKHILSELERRGING